jgi:predicted MPP superfamily phosphohydrolase|tara:strand:- start:17177 stop:18457 length:1281 start_codon:yes stop_codon:yes gene_type:complete
MNIIALNYLKNPVQKVLVTILFIAIVFAIDLYVFQGFKVVVKKWVPTHSGLAHVLYWAIPVFLLAFVLVRVVWFPESSKNNYSIFINSFLIALFLAKFIWLFFILTDDLIRLVRFTSDQFVKPVTAKNISRSEFIVTAGFLAASSLFGSLIYGIASGAHNYTVKKRKLPIKGLPKPFVGLRLVQISDIHSGSFWSKNSVQEGVNMINDLKPDLFFFTGDLVNNSADEFDGFKEMFSGINARLGSYSVLGNHDYGDYVRWPNKDGVTKSENLMRLKKHHQDLGWNLLVNDHDVINIDGEELAILGVENWSAHRRFPKYGDLGKAIKGVESVKNKLLLSHDPSHWRAQILNQNPSIKATFSGHTHGMQFGIDSKYYKWSPVKYQYPEWVDMYTENNQHLYVNRGFGYLGYPGRFGFLPEITLFELESV